MLTIIYLKKCKELKQHCILLDKVTKLVVSLELLWRKIIKNKNTKKIISQTLKLIEFSVKFKEIRNYDSVKQIFLKYNKLVTRPAGNKHLAVTVCCAAASTVTWLYFVARSKK